MRLAEVRKILGATWASSAPSADFSERAVLTCQASDLISDILSLRGPGSLLLTGLTNTQVVRTAEILDFVAICFVRGKMPQGETVQLASGKGIPLLVTPLSMYESCGRLHAAGVPAAAGEEGIDCPTEKLRASKSSSTSSGSET